MVDAQACSDPGINVVGDGSNSLSAKLSLCV